MGAGFHPTGQPVADVRTVLKRVAAPCLVVAIGFWLLVLGKPLLQFLAEAAANAHWILLSLVPAGLAWLAGNR